MMNALTRFPFTRHVVLSALCVTFGALIAGAQSYSVDWHSVDGGGSTSTGGVYSVSGTIGQPDAGKLSAGNFTLDGGFWGIIAAVPSPGALLLRIQWAAPSTLLVAWPTASAGFALQQNSVLGTTNWIAVTNQVTVVGTENQVLISPPSGNRFFRLVHP